MQQNASEKVNFNILADIAKLLRYLPDFPMQKLCW